MPKRVTLADIARRTGLSTAAVSMALHNAPDSRIPDATVRRVRHAADELGYVVDVNARSLRTGCTGVMGFISDQVTLTRFASAMLRGILDVAEEHNQTVMIIETDRDPQRYERGVTTLRSRRVDSLIVGLMTSRHITLPLGNWHVPAIVANGTANGISSVLPLEYQAGQDVVHHLVYRGHRRIAMIGHHTTPPAPEVSATIGMRMHGIDDAMSEAGLTFVSRFDGRVWEPELGHRGVDHILEARPTAIIAANDRIAFGIYERLRQRGLSIPQDVSVISFDDEELAALMHPGLTTMRLPYFEMGQAAAAQVLGLPVGGMLPTAVTTSEGIDLPLTGVWRESVADLH